MFDKILLIDDDEKILDLLQDYLGNKGYKTFCAKTGEEGLIALNDFNPDIIVLDLMLPQIDGFEVLRRIRTISDIPIIMLTALEDETDRIVGLEMGADDYLHKPINPRELVARIKVVLRRCNSSFNTQKKSEVKNIKLFPKRSEVRIDDKDAGLTSVEFDILYTLAKSKGRIVTRDLLMDLARGKTFEAFDRSIDVHISRIRKKIEDDPSKPKLIKTVWGKGYMWEGENI